MQFLLKTRAPSRSVMLYDMASRPSVPMVRFLPPSLIRTAFTQRTSPLLVELEERKVWTAYPWNETVFARVPQDGWVSFVIWVNVAVSVETVPGVAGASEEALGPSSTYADIPATATTTNTRPAPSGLNQHQTPFRNDVLAIKSLCIMDFIGRPVRTSSASPERAESKRTSESLQAKPGILRVVKFAIASGLGFLVAEAILVLGVLAFYHTTKVPSLDFSSADLLGLDALAFGVGVAAAFIINERVTVRDLGEQRRTGRASWIVRLCKYELSSLLGNIIIVGVQLAVLATASLSPVFGSVVGAVVSYPVTYVVSMRFVWRVRPLGE